MPMPLGIERERTAYREYIEQWIHEIKTPITAMRLLCENNRTPFTKELLAQLEKTDRYTEQAAACPVPFCAGGS